MARIFNFFNNIFGKEKKKTSLDWKIVAQRYPVTFPESADITSLIEFNGGLYGILSSSGRLLKWNGVDAWMQVAANWGGGTTSIGGLVVLNNVLYGFGRDDGTLQKFTGSGWLQVAPALAGKGIYCSVVYNNKIYAGTSGVLSDLLYEWNGVNAWVQVAPHLNQSRIDALVVFNNQLYASASGSTPYPELYRWNGVNAWVSVLPRAVNVNSIIYAMVVFNGKLYAIVSAPGDIAELWEWDGSAPIWTRVSDNAVDNTGAPTGIASLAQYNGSLFAGTTCKYLYRWNGVDRWVRMTTSYKVATTVYALAVFQGNLYGSNKELYEFFYAPTKTSTSEGTSSSLVVTDSTGVRVSTVRHITTLTPWIA